MHGGHVSLLVLGVDWAVLVARLAAVLGWGCFGRLVGIAGIRWLGGWCGFWVLVAG